MKDFLGNELNVGDKVVYVRRNYRDLATGEVVSIGPKKVTITEKEFGQTYRFPSQVVKYCSPNPEF